jgi:hypothetical protein
MGVWYPLLFSTLSPPPLTSIQICTPNVHSDDFVVSGSLTVKASTRQQPHEESVMSLFGDVIENYFSTLDPVVQSSLQSLLQDLPTVPAIDLAVASSVHTDLLNIFEDPFYQECITKITTCVTLREKRIFGEAQSKLEETWVLLNNTYNAGSSDSSTSRSDQLSFLIIMCLIERGRNGKDQKDFEQALVAFQQALNLALEIEARDFEAENEDISVLICIIHYELGVTSEGLSKSANSISSYVMHLRLSSKMRPSKIDWGAFSDSCYQLALTLKNGESLRLAEEYVSRAAAAAAKANDSSLSTKCSSLLK